MNQSVEDQAECPLCLEPFEVDDVNFFPCTCGYQICRFCWHRIRTNENGLCPACRKAYEENPADFKPLSQEQVAKLKAEKRQKEQQRKQKATESRKHLANVRVVQKNLVFVVGLPIRLADANVLKKHEYFGKFGKIHKVVINQSTSYAGATGPSASAYVTYSKCEDALRAIQSVNNICVDSRTLKTSLGTTKYCSHFIKTQTCPKQDCMYLHDLGDSEASFTKEEMQQGKHQEYEKKLHEQLNNSLSRDRKSTPSPPNNSGTGTVKEGWPTLQNDSVSTSTTITISSTNNTTPPLTDTSTVSNQQQQQTEHTTGPQMTTTATSGDTSTTNKQNGKSKEKNKDKTSSNNNNCDKINGVGGNRRKGKEKQLIDDKDNDDDDDDVDSKKKNEITDKSIINNHRTSLFDTSENNSFFSSNNFTKISTGLKETVPQNGFIKLTDNLHLNNIDETTQELLLDKENKKINKLGNSHEEVLTNGYSGHDNHDPYKYQQQPSVELLGVNGTGETSGVYFQNNQNLFHNFLTSANNQKLMKDPELCLQQNYLMKQQMALQQQQQQQQYVDNVYRQQQQQQQQLNYLQQQQQGFTSKQTNYLNNYNNSNGTYHLQEQMTDKNLVNGYYEKELRINDDDLGFDPFHETQKALADIIEKESQLSKLQSSHFNYDNLTHHKNFNHHHHHQLNLLNQQNHTIGSKILSQFQPQQVLTPNQRLPGTDLTDGLRSTLPPPGFANPTHSYNPSRNNMTNGDNSPYQSHYLVNGLSKSGEWPENLRFLLPESSSSPTTSSAPSFTSLQKGWSPVTNCTDWTTLDPAIVSSRPHNPAQSLLSNQDFSLIQQNQFQSQMSQLQIGHMLGQQNNWLHRQQKDENMFCKNNWSANVHNTNAPPPGFSLRHNSPDLKKSFHSIIDGL